MNTTNRRVLTAVQTPEQKIAELQALVAQLTAQQQPTERALSLKVSPKGAMSIYGLGRFPVTLYASQWERVLESANDIKQFITDNASALTRK